MPAGTRRDYEEGETDMALMALFALLIAAFAGMGAGVRLHRVVADDVPPRAV